MIPKKLIEARDHAALEAYTPLDYIHGFDHAVKLLLESEELRGLVESNDFYADKCSYGEDRLVGHPEQPDVEYQHDVFDDNGENARNALAQWREYIGGEDE